MHNCAKSSKIFKKMKGTKIPYTIDFDNWKFNKQDIAKNKIGLNYDKSEKVVIFGSERGSKIDRKNFKTVIQSLENISKKIKIKYLVFGESEKNYEKKNLSVNYLGKILDKKYLNYIYSAGDVLAMPSKLETFGLIAIESILSGTPCVAFANTGLEEIIEHKINGYLSNYLDQSDYEKGLMFFLNKNKKLI